MAFLVPPVYEWTFENIDGTSVDDIYSGVTATLENVSSYSDDTTYIGSTGNNAYRRVLFPSALSFKSLRWRGKRHSDYSGVISLWPIHSTSGSDSVFYLAKSTSGSKLWYRNGAGSDIQIGTATITDNAWHDFVIVEGPSGPGYHIVYLDGVDISGGEINTGWLAIKGFGVNLLSFSWGIGYIDDIQVLDYALSASQVLGLYNGDDEFGIQPSMVDKGWDANKRFKLTASCGALAVTSPIQLPLIISHSSSLPSADDDFTGDDDTQVNTTRWNQYITQGSVSNVYCAIYQNALKISCKALSSGYNAVELWQRPRVFGDFDVSCDVVSFTDTPSNAVFCRLSIEFDDGEVVYASFSFNSGLKKFQLHDGTTPTDIARANSSGKLKLTRTDSSIGFHYIDGSGSTYTLGKTSTVTDVGGVVYLTLYHYVGSNIMTVVFDNLIVSADHIDWPGSGITGFDASALFDDLGSNYAKIALEIGDTGVECDIELLTADWDDTGETATIYPIFPTLADGDEFHLWYDSTHADNANVSVITTAPSAPASGDELTLWSLAVADNLFTWSLVSSGTLLRALFDQVFDLEKLLLRVLFDQNWMLTEAQRALFDQVFGLRMLAMFVQKFGDMPQFRALFDQRFRSAYPLRRIFEQGLVDANSYRATFDQLVSYPEALRQVFHQKYGLQGDALRAMFDQTTALLDKDQLRALFQQAWVLAAGEAAVEKGAVTVRHPHDDSAYVSARGTSAVNVMVEQDEDSYFMSGSLQLTDEAEFARYGKYMEGVEITIAGQSYKFMTEIPYVSRRGPADDTYIVPLVSATKLLDYPHNRQQARDFVGLVSTFVKELAAPFVLDWQLVDWVIPAGVYASTGESAIEIIRHFAAEAGGIVQTLPDGTIVCRPEYQTVVPEWETATPDVTLTDQDDFFEMQANPQQRPGYNIYTLYDKSLGGDGVTMDVERKKKNENHVRVFVTPWADRYTCDLKHSGGAWVQIIKNGVKAEEVEEQVELKSGAGQVSKPCYGLIEVDWRERDLGGLVFLEDGTIETETATDLHSLVGIKYRTKYHSFTVRDDKIEDVQLYPEVIDPNDQ